MTYTEKMHRALRRDTETKHNAIKDLLDEIERLQTELAAEKELHAGECEWMAEDDGEYNVYATSCGNYFSLESGTPSENGFTYCCSCGKLIKEARPLPPAPEEDEE